MIRWAIFVFVALASILLLPELAPVSPSVSASYIFGYNNRVGVLLLIGFLVCGGVFSKELGVAFLPPSVGKKIPVRLIALWMGIFAAAWAVMYLLVHGLGGFGESLYLIDRVKMLSEGRRPYRDFEFAYGILFLYGPRALMALHLSAEQAYFMMLLLCQLGGVWMLSRVLDLMDYPSRYTASIYSIVCLFSLPMTISTGLNYTLVRFITGSYFGLLVHRSDARGGRGHRVRAMLMSTGFTVVMLMISPEMGIAYAVGTMGYFAVFGRWDWRSAAEYTAFLGLESVILLVADRLNVFATLRAFSGGAFSFPILPAGHILLFFFGCGLLSLFVAVRLRAGSRGDGMLMVIAVSAATLFAALGRCDVGHTGLSAIGLVIAAIILASTFPRVWKGYRIAFLVLFIVVPTITGVWNYKTELSKLVFLRLFQYERQGLMTPMDAFIDRGMQRQLGAEKGQIKFDKLKASSSLATEFVFHEVYPELVGIVEAPFGYSPRGFGIYHSPRIDEGYFAGLNNLFTPTMVKRKIGELQEHPDRKLLLPENFNEQCRVDPSAAKDQIRTLFAYPYRGTVRHAEGIWDPLCGYINEHYRKIADMGPRGYGYVVWAE
jgi:hypothetical protein